jgi:hypothetical protein
MGTGATVGAGKWARITVEGKVAVEHNPVFVDCDSTYATKAPFAPAQAGPRGHPANTNYLQVYVRRKGSASNITIGLVDGDSAVAGRVIYSVTDTAIEVRRSGVAGGRTCDGVGTGYYALSGNQKIRVEQLADPEIHALRSVVPSADTVPFAASYPEELTSVWWIYKPGDTLAVPSMNVGTLSSISACTGQPTCRHRVTASGRMYLKLANGTGGHVFYPSQTVWVGKVPAEGLTVVCEPAEVPRTSSTTCTAGSSGPSAPEVREWFFVPDSVASAEEARMDACGAVNPCTTSIPQAGTMYARATLSGVDQTEGAHVSVGDAPRLFRRAVR